MSLELYKKMLTSRSLEQEFIKLFKQGRGFDLHPNIGQEAIEVGVCSVLKEQDYSVCTHRSVTHAIARGVPLKPLVCELLGRREGMNRGLAGEMHMNYPAKRFMFSFQQVGTHLPVAAGIAWASKYVRREVDTVTACFVGDAALSNGQFYEGLNLAVLLKLPILIIVENNHRAGNITPKYYQFTQSDAIDRFDAYPVMSSYCDGRKVDQVANGARKAREWVAKYGRPFLFECSVERCSNHKLAQGDIRPKDEVEQLLMDNDPCIFASEQLGLSLEEEVNLQKDIEDEVNSAIEYALASPLADLA